MSPPPILLSAREAGDILAALEAGDTARVSLDLGRTGTVVRRRGRQVELAAGQRVDLETLRRIADSPADLFVVEGGRAEKLARFSEHTQRTYRLRPTPIWPALEIGGVLMHRVKGTDPRTDAEAKLALVGPVRGAALDTCCGLGYTAILMARTARAVTTIEADETVLELARLNPHSRPLWEDPAITLIRGDAAEVVSGMPGEAFDAVVHDPPTLALAGDLYADAFYEQLFRVLARGARLLHYVGAPGARHRRVDLAGRVAGRLRQIGFGEVRRHGALGCVTARRPRE